MSPGISVETVDYQNPRQAQALIDLLDHYARDPMGGGEPLAAETRKNLTEALGRVPGAFSVLLWKEDRPVGLLNAFASFSTFKAKPILNVHDVIVHADYRGQGLTRRLFDALEAEARRRGCCKVTLEVLQGNGPARQAYRRLGFEGYALDARYGQAEFWEKPLD